MSGENLKDWVKTCMCNGDCSECEKSLEECRKDLYKITKVLLGRTKLPPEENPKLYS